VVRKNRHAAGALDRIYRMNRIFFVFFPKEWEKDNPPIGEKVLLLTLFAFPGWFGFL
jgi:hypothetical protein